MVGSTASAKPDSSPTRYPAAPAAFDLRPPPRASSSSNACARPMPMRMPTETAPAPHTTGFSLNFSRQSSASSTPSLTDSYVSFTSPYCCETTSLISATVSLIDSRVASICRCSSCFEGSPSAARDSSRPLFLTIRLRSFAARASRRAHHRLQQVFEQLFAVAAEARVDGRGLDDRAARGDQPVEAGARREPPDGAGPVAALADRGDGVEVALNGRRVQPRVERGEPRAIQLAAR